MSCVVPGCKSGYGTKNVYPPGVGKHRFPKDLAIRKRWIEAIPRADWEPSEHSRICSLHFDELDYETKRNDSNKHRKTEAKLKNKQLKSDAVPRYFPGCPSYLSSKQRQPDRSEASTSAARWERMARATEDRSREFLSSDDVSDFHSLVENLPTEFPPSWNVITLKKNDRVLIEDVEFDEDGKPKFRFSMAVHADLSFSLHRDDSLICPTRVKHITEGGKIKRHSDVSNILAFLNSSSTQQVMIL